MASVRKQVVVDVPLATAWDAVRDFGALHRRLVPGFVTDARVEGDERVVTFFNGNVFRERLISASDDEHRLVWTIVDGPWTHHNGCLELFAEGARRTRLVWTTDLLPHDLAARTGASMEQAMPIIKQTLEATAA
jgi:Polyketide cyclase / dehydrase and lipid transport